MNTPSQRSESSDQSPPPLPTAQQQPAPGLSSNRPPQLPNVPPRVPVAPPAAQPAAVPFASDSSARVTRMTLFALGGFLACLLLVGVGVAVGLLLRSTPQPEVAQQPPAAESPALNVPAPPRLPDSPLPQPEARPNVETPAVKAIETGVNFASAYQGPPPPTFDPQRPSALGRKGELDKLRPPESLRPGMLAFLQGLDQLVDGRPAEAAGSFSTAIEADEENPDFHAARGSTLVVSQKMEQALPDLQRALRLNPDHLLASRMARLAYLMMGDQLTASKFKGHGSHAGEDFLITDVGVGYGNKALSQKHNYPLGPQDAQKYSASLTKLPAVALMIASSFQTDNLKSAEALYALGVSQIQTRDYSAARRSFNYVTAHDPHDWSAMYYHARGLLETGDPELARNELTFVLSWTRFLPEAYAARALCAVKQNDLVRAQADLAIVRELAPGLAGEVEAAMAARGQTEGKPGKDALPPLQLLPGENEAAAWERLLAASTPTADFHQLTSIGLALRRSVDARRRRWDETYQQQLFQLVSAARAHPGDAERLADVAEFLREHNKNLALTVAPNTPPRYLRRQTNSTAQWEIELAFTLVNEGLNANGRNARCWAVKSAILLHHYLDLPAAEQAARYAVQFDPRLIAAHMALSDCCQEYATRLRERAAALRAPKPVTRTVEVVDSNGRFIRNDTETIYIPASPEELAQAAECDRQAGEWERTEQFCFDNALAAAKGTKEEPFYQALMLYMKQDYAGARPWLERAVRENPGDPAMRRRLAACLEKLGLDEEALEERSRAVNLQHTTADLWLQVAWQKLERGTWTKSRQALLRAREIDPADARVAAFESVLAEYGDQDASRALSATQVALAQEEARAMANQTSFLPLTNPQGRLTPNDMGLWMVLCLRGGKAIFRAQPAKAAELYLSTAAAEARLSDFELAKPVPAAMLPWPQRDPKATLGPPPLVSLLKNNRIFAGQALLNAGQKAAAAQQFAAAENFAHRLPVGGTAYLDFELESQYVPFRVSSMAIYAKALNAIALLQQGRQGEARLALQEVRFYLANRTQEQREMADDPIPALYAELAPAVGLR